MTGSALTSRINLIQSHRTKETHSAFEIYYIRLSLQLSMGLNGNKVISGESKCDVKARESKLKRDSLCCKWITIFRAIYFVNFVADATVRFYSFYRWIKISEEEFLCLKNSAEKQTHIEIERMKYVHTNWYAYPSI